MTSGMKNKIINKARSTVRSDLATMVRLAFHDCVGNIALAVAVVVVVAVAVVCNTLHRRCGLRRLHQRERLVQQRAGGPGGQPGDRLPGQCLQRQRGVQVCWPKLINHILNVKHAQ